MARYARLDCAAVIEIITLPEGIALADAFHPDLVAELVTCADEVAVGWEYTAGTFAPPVTAVPDTSWLLAYAADKRWRVENGGIVAAGVPVETDDRAKLMITGSRLAAMADPLWSTVWDGADGGSYPVDAAAMVVISDAVQAHVSAAFATYATVRAAIEAGTITTISEIDAADWPG
ncbi:DUF4376 domain-containing protein [Ancylobacter sp. WKF20]|uniref:DUF4376 domain-containing protein n=1 Tax=Ancylobacter sp. WKF20 TaxID=3039801 RepID=UPI0024341762|nr:DUF4376 domain-containing protein [Ancylobacter sp. WKF20]WGD31192.1 DUF4376 domain-containing protein [Ancylobacter sp. WKF20]